ncbi:MAG: TMEM175 family protein [Ktedonobacteraceae bacterium]
MRTYYNRIAGQSLERLAALSDGIFAVAMTLLVLDLRIPVSQHIIHEQDLLSALTKLGPNILPYFMSFLTLGIFWVGQQTQLNNFTRSNRHLTWLNLVFLLAVTLTPFSTGLLAAFITFRLAIVVYWLNIVLLGSMLFISWRYARHAQLLKDKVTEEIFAANQRRIVIAQSLYAFGALLCIINTYVSIGFIVLVQLNYAIAPRFGRLDRL